MPLSFEVLYLPLAQAADWQVLQSKVLRSKSHAVERLIGHLQAAGAQSALFETKYIDRDYSSEYRVFYSQTFKVYQRHCERVHFFACDIKSIVDEPDWKKRAVQLEGVQSQYLGFTVLEPIASSRLGRTVLHPVTTIPDSDVAITIRSEHRVNLLGASLKVTGPPFIQQDARVGACAQATIWMAARHMHARYGYGWFSISDITQLASQPTDRWLSRQLPAGSDFLTVDSMARAFRAMGYQPLCYEPSSSALPTIVRYADSGLPTVLGLQLDGGIGHAVTVVGMVFKPFSAFPSGSSHHTFSSFIRALVIHDDQGGPYQLLAADTTSASDPSFADQPLAQRELNGKMSVLNVADHVRFVLVPMPLKVFSKAEAAEVLAMDRIRDLLRGLANIEEHIAKSGQALNPLARELYESYSRGELVLRTYLSSAGHYRKHLARGCASTQLKDKILYVHLPHFIWVTEIATLASFNQKSAGLRKVYGHIVTDGTASGQHHAAVLIAHLPGLLILQDSDPTDLIEEAPAQVDVIADDVLYEARKKDLDG